MEYTSLPGIDVGEKCGLGNFASGPQRTIDLGSQEPVSQHCSNGTKSLQSLSGIIFGNELGFNQVFCRWDSMPRWF